MTKRIQALPEMPTPGSTKRGARSELPERPGAPKVPLRGGAAGAAVTPAPGGASERSSGALQNPPCSEKPGSPAFDPSQGSVPRWAAAVSPTQVTSPPTTYFPRSQTSLCPYSHVATCHQRQRIICHFLPCKSEPAGRRERSRLKAAPARAVLPRHPCSHTFA